MILKVCAGLPCHLQVKVPGTWTLCSSVKKIVSVKVQLWERSPSPVKQVDETTTAWQPCLRRYLTRSLIIAFLVALVQARLKFIAKWKTFAWFDWVCYTPHERPHLQSIAAYFEESLKLEHLSNISGLSVESLLCQLLPLLSLKTAKFCSVIFSHY